MAPPITPMPIHPIRVRVGVIRIGYLSPIVASGAGAVKELQLFSEVINHEFVRATHGSPSSQTGAFISNPNKSTKMHSSIF